MSDEKIVVFSAFVKIMSDVCLSPLYHYPLLHTDRRSLAIYGEYRKSPERNAWDIGEVLSGASGKSGILTVW